MRSYKAIWFCVCISLLSGCENQTETHQIMHTYTERVAYVLDQALPELEHSTFPALPPTRDRYQETTDIREGLLDLLDLSECNLIPLIAQRNSSLGKVLAPSQRLVYEVTFYNRLLQCIPLLASDTKTDPDTLKRVKDIAKIKGQELPLYFWNALYSGQEIDLSLSLNQSSISEKDPLSTHLSLSSWSYFAELSSRLLHEDYEQALVMLKSIESHMENLYKDPIGTPLLRSLQSIEVHLTRTAIVIENRLSRRPLCFKNMSNPKADILKRVFITLYADEIQPYMAYIHRLAEQWFSAHETIRYYTSAPQATNLYDAKVFQRNTDISIWNQYIKARDRHTLAWQALLTQCNLMPSVNNR